MISLMRGLAVFCLVVCLLATFATSVVLPSGLRGSITFNAVAFLTGLFAAALSYGLFGSIAEGLTLLSDIRDSLRSAQNGRAGQSTAPAGASPDAPQPDAALDAFRTMTFAGKPPIQAATTISGAAVTPQRTQTCRACGQDNPSFEINCIACGEKL